MKEEKVELGEDFKMSENTQMTIITLNVNGMNAPIKQNQIVEWIRNQKPTICCLQETHMRQLETHRVKMKGWNKIYWASTEKRKAGVAIMISSKAKVKIDLIKRDRKGNYILIKAVYTLRKYQYLTCMHQMV